MGSADHQSSETARKSEVTWLHAFAADRSVSDAAELLGVSIATVSRFKTNGNPIGLIGVCRLLAYLGLKIVPADHVVVDPDEYRLAMRVLADYAAAKAKNP